MSLTASMHTALNGLQTSQKAISIISENVNNVDTEGYARKKVSQQTIILPGGYTSGAKINTNLRQVDEQLRTQYRTESGTMQAHQVRSYYLDLIQAKMGTVASESSLSNRVAALQSAFESLGVDSDKLNSQQTAVTSLDTALSQMKALSDEIQSLRQETDNTITELCKDVTDILNQIDKLNDDIVRTEAVGNMTSDNYRDERDTLITQLSEIMDIQYYERSTGELVVLTTGGKPLVDKDAVTVYHTSAAQMGSLVNYSSGEITGLFAGTFDITNEVKSGELYGLIQLRDNELQNLQMEMDELGYQLQTSLNKVSNQGTCYPTMTYELTGTRTFIDTQRQSVSFGDGQDVKILLFDEHGNQAFETSLVSNLNFSSGSIDELVSTMRDWLTTDKNGPLLETATCKIDTDGHLRIDLGTSAYSIAFRDEKTVVQGSDPQPITISFDNDGSGRYGETFEGFSSFLGLNDLIVYNQNDCVYDSNLIGRNSLMGIRGVTTLNIYDSETGLDGGWHIDVMSYDTIDTIAEKINTTCVNPDGTQAIEAKIVREGSSYRLRILNQSGNQTEISETLHVQKNGTNSGSVIQRLGLDVSHACYASNLGVRKDIIDSPNTLSTGMVQFSTETNAYYLAETDNSLANSYAAIFSEERMFEAAGSFSKIKTTLADYASSIVGGLASRLADANSKYEYQSDLVSQLYEKEQNISGVDLDEELANLLLFQRSYSAAAKVLSTSVEMLEMLDNLI